MRALANPADVTCYANNVNHKTACHRLSLSIGLAIIIIIGINIIKLRHGPTVPHHRLLTILSGELPQPEDARRRRSTRDDILTREYLLTIRLMKRRRQRRWPLPSGRARDVSFIAGIAYSDHIYRAHAARHVKNKPLASLPLCGGRNGISGRWRRRDAGITGRKRALSMSRQNIFTLNFMKPRRVFLA